VLKQLIPILLIASYPFIVHYSVILAKYHLLIAGPILCLIALFWKKLFPFNLKNWLLFIFLIAIFLVIDFFKLTLYWLFLPPIAVPLVLLFIFGRTLTKGKEPLITAIGETARGPLSQSMRHYTRRLTQLWCMVFIAMASWAFILPWLKDPTLWSWFTNVINYGLVGVLFLGEFVVRTKLFPDHDHPGFLDYLRIIARHDIRD
jgi:uncharacterized membrane protein